MSHHNNKTESEAKATEEANKHFSAPPPAARTDAPPASSSSASPPTASQPASTTSSAVVPHNPHVSVRTRSPAAEEGGGALVSLNPATRRVAIGIGKAGISIADGMLLSCSRILNPVISASFVVYESVKVIQAYRHGDLNRLGYRTTKGDVALRIGKELTMMGVGIAIGQGIGALIGLSAIPVAGQLVVATLLSVGLGICVGTLVTHYVDRFTARMQLRNQYGYPSDERGTRRRFEALLERRHDLSTMETCRLVQHYVDYRVACGWESATDLDDYRASGDITLMPASLQHFAVVQLQRKWGFVKVRAQCRQIYRALLLVHHPDRGGSTELAAQLNKDFEFFAFCQGWDSDCATLLRSATADGDGGAAAEGAGGAADANARRRRGNVVVDYLRSLFRLERNSQVGANDLHQFGLLTLEAGTPAELHRLDVEASPSLTSSFVGASVPRRARRAGSNGSASLEGTRTSIEDIESFSDEDGEDDGAVTAAVRQRSVTRVLSSLHEAYAATAELITFSGLIRVSDDPAAWAALHADVSLFQRLQYFVSMHTLVQEHQEKTECCAPGSTDTTAPNTASGACPPVHAFGGFRWRTVDEAVARREEVRRAIVATVFTEGTSQQLSNLLDLWRTAKAVAESYFRVCQQREGVDGAGFGHGGGHKDEGRQTLDALLRIHKQLDAAGAAARGSWHGRLEEWATRTAPGFSSFMEDVKEVGQTASNALAAEYTIHSLPSEQDQCLEYGRTWTRKQDTLQALLSELHLAYKEREAAAAVSDDLARRIEDYQSQLLLLHKQMAVVDVGIAEWLSACTTHFPELAPSLRLLPSTCLQAVAAWTEAPGERSGDAAAVPPRFVAFERERTLLHYTRVEPEPTNPLDPFTSRAVTAEPTRDILRQDVTVIQDEAAETVLTSFETDQAVADVVVSPDGVGMALLQAVYNDPLTGEITPCWLKRYTFPSAAGTGAAAATLRRLACRIMAEEVRPAERCHSDRLVTARDVFYHRERHELFVHYVRGATQQRFRSVNDVRRQIEPLGLRWLHDVLECVIGLHACQLAHGQLSLSSFTYDDFGNTALGTFFPAWSGVNVAPAAALPLAEQQRRDVVDLGIMLLTEVLPLLPHAQAAVAPSSVVATVAAAVAGATPLTSPTTAGADDASGAAEVARVVEAVASHLVGKEEPIWSLLDARTFVRRSLQLRLGDVAAFSKLVVPPASWAVRGPSPPVQLVAADATHFHFRELPPSCTVRVYQNRHLSLWETYWRCRRKMVTLHHGTYTLPSAIAQAPAVLPCSDDYEVRERYLWVACDDEEQAWTRCQDGFRALQRGGAPLPPAKDMAPFALDAILAPGSATWGVLCRVALGTTVEETPAEFEAAESLADTTTTQYNKVSYAAQRRSHFVTPQAASVPLVWVPSPWARCYPEYIVHITQ